MSEDQNDDRAARDAALVERMKDPEYRAAFERFMKKRRPDVVSFDRSDDGGLVLDTAGDDPLEHIIRLAGVFNSGSTSFPRRQLHHLCNMVSPDDQKPGQTVNSMLSVIDATKPENEHEAMLATQMAAVHQAAMQNLGVSVRSRDPETIATTGNLANKLLRTYTMQLEALAKLRRVDEPSARVGSVSVYAGGQAIVGNVGAGAWGKIENARQPHALGYAFAGSAAYALSYGGPVLCQDAERVCVSSASGERQGAVPNARRSKGKRRAQG